MQITVFGSSGQVGRLVVAEALKRGYKVIAFVHRTHSVADHPNLRICQGDITDPASVRAALQGSDAVVSVLSSWKSKSRDTLTRGMKSIIPAMEQSKAERIISLTGADALTAEEGAPLLNKVSRFLFQCVAKGILEDGEKHITLLQKSSLDWTVIRSPVMTKKLVKAYVLTKNILPPYLSIPRMAVARAIVDQLTAENFQRSVASIKPA